MNVSGSWVMKNGKTERVAGTFKNVKQLRNYCRNNRKKDAIGFWIADVNGDIKSYVFPTNEHSHH